MLPGIWSRRGPLALLLWPLSLLYGWIVRVRRGCYRAGLFRVVRVSAPVVVVGNVIVGGSGKTPVLMELARHLSDHGHRVGVLSRGYGRRGRDCLEVSADGSASDFGDEPLLIKRTLGVPVFVANDRGQAAVSLLSKYPATTVILCDDGLQHLGLARDIEICLFHDQGLGNGFLLPAGPLREPWPRSVDLVLSAARPPAPGHFRVERQLASRAIRSDGSSVTLDALRGKRLVALAAIAHPENFFSMLRAQGLELEQTIALADHDNFDDFQWPADDARELVFTEKDATKIWSKDAGGWAIPLLVSLDPGFILSFDRLLEARLSLRTETLPDAKDG